MRMLAVSDDRSVLTGLRLAGIEGVFAREAGDLEAAVQSAGNDPDCAALLITESCAERIPETVTRLKLSSVSPLLVVIPDAGGSRRPSDSITATIREAIGIKL